jgi:hypothetical protein
MVREGYQMKNRVKSQIVTGVLALCGIAALTVQADPDTYEGRRVRGVETQNGGAVQTRNGAAAAETKNGGAVQTRRGGTGVSGPNGTAVETRNGNVYTKPSDNKPSDNGRTKNGNVVEGPNGKAVRTPNGVYTKPK